MEEMSVPLWCAQGTQQQGEAARMHAAAAKLLSSHRISNPVPFTQLPYDPARLMQTRTAVHQTVVRLRCLCTEDPNPSLCTSLDRCSCMAEPARPMQPKTAAHSDVRLQELLSLNSRPTPFCCTLLYPILCPSRSCRKTPHRCSAYL